MSRGEIRATGSEDEVNGQVEAGPPLQRDADGRTITDLMGALNRALAKVRVPPAIREASDAAQRQREELRRLDGPTHGPVWRDEVNEAKR